MGKVKKKAGISGAVKRAVSIASPRAGKILETASALRGKARGGRAAYPRRRSRALNINRYAKRLLKAKLDAKIMKEKLKVINAVR